MRKKLMSMLLVAIMVVSLVPVVPVSATEVEDPWESAMEIEEGENDLEGTPSYWYYENGTDEDVTITLYSSECDEYDPKITEYVYDDDGEMSQAGHNDDVDEENEDYNFSYTTSVAAGDTAYFMVEEADGEQGFEGVLNCEVEEESSGGSEEDTRWDNAPTLTAGKTPISEPSYFVYENTTSNPVGLTLYSSEDAEGDPYIDRYELTEDGYDDVGGSDDAYEDGLSFYYETTVYPGKTAYFCVTAYGYEYDETFTYNMNCEITELKTIKSINKVVKNPTKGLTTYLEFIDHYFYEEDGEEYNYFETDLDLTGLQLEVQYTDNTTAVVEYGKSGDWDFGCQGDWSTVGTKKLLLTYDNYASSASIELDCTVDSLLASKNIVTTTVGTETTASYNNGAWSVYRFTPSQTGYYNLVYYTAYARDSDTDVVLYDETENIRLVNISMNYDGINTHNYLIAGKTYYMFVRVNKAGRTLKWNLLPGSNAVEEGVTIQQLSSQTYTGNPIVPKPVVYYMNKDVTKYTNGYVYYYYYDNIEAGTATILAEYGFRDDNGSYHYGRVYTTFNICKPIDKANVTLSNLTYTGKVVTPTATVKLGKDVLQAGVDYKVIADTNANAGTRTATIQGIGKYNGSVKKTYVINKASQTIDVADEFIKHKKSTKFALNAKAVGALTYQTSAKKIATVDTAGKVKLNKKYGVANITINAAATANYNAASKVVKVIVTSKSTKLVSVKSTSKKKATVKIKKATGAQGYEISYSTDENFVSDVKTTTTKKTTATLKKLKSKKTYYVRVRSYRKVSGKKLYSEYSPAKKVKVK